MSAITVKYTWRYRNGVFPSNERAGTGDHHTMSRDAADIIEEIRTTHVPTDYRFKPNTEVNFIPSAEDKPHIDYGEKNDEKI